MSDTTSIGSVLNQRINTNNNVDQNSSELKIVKISKDLANNSQSKKISGTVNKKSDDGTVNIRTDKGDITLKSEKPISTEEGDKVEIKISSGNPSQTASINTQRKIENQDVPQTKSYYTDIKNTNTLPTTSNLQDLINGQPIKVETFPTSLLPTITDINVEVITYNKNILPSHDLITVTNPVISDNQITISSNDALLPITQITDNSLLTIQPISTDQYFSITSLNPTNTEIPLYFIATKIASNPQMIPIKTDMLTSSDTPPPSLSEINITDAKTPLIEITPPQTNEKSEHKIKVHNEDTTPIRSIAGETHATLVGFTENKHLPIIRITAPESRNDQHYVLQTPISDIPLGTQFELDTTQVKQITQIAQTQQFTSIIAPNPVGVSNVMTPEIWQIMQDTHIALIQSNPPAAKAFMNTIPNAGSPANIQSTALFFIAALRSGDIQNWIGEKAIESLKRAGKSDIINRLSGEISSLARFANDQSPQEWRTLSLPMAWQNDIHKIIINYRKEEDNNSDDENINNGTKTRFVMDINLSKIGKVQLDGLFIGNNDSVGRMDLILRTEQIFSQAMKQEMRIAYKNALDQTNFTGELSFQGQTYNWVEISPDIDSEFIEDV
ncbi:MAG: hypothetical protein ACRBB3_05100 [Alphaproteobacteria bacterium]